MVSLLQVLFHNLVLLLVRASRPFHNSCPRHKSGLFVVRGSPSHSLCCKFVSQSLLTILLTALVTSPVHSLALFYFPCCRFLLRLQLQILTFLIACPSHTPLHVLMTILLTSFFRSPSMTYFVTEMVAI